MASRLSHLCTLLFTILFLFSPAPIAATSSSRAASRDTICSGTPHPAFCRSLLPNNSSGTIHDYARFCVTQSISTANNFLSMVNQHMKSQSQYSQSTVYALEDCQFLAAINIDFLLTTTTSINSTESLSTSEADGVLSFLSAAITNLQTCLDGLQYWPLSSVIANDLSPYFSNGTMLYSVSLALVTSGWASDTSHGRQLTGEEAIFFNGKARRFLPWPSEILNRDRNSLSKHTKRRMLQLDGHDVEVNDSVVVNPDGTGNFTTIGDAVAAAPNGTKAGSGFFLIFVVAGVYQEYVSIPKQKKYLMMVGEGINQTVITGNRNVVDGWTTFNSATFAVVAEGFLAVNMTFRNTAGAIKQQAVAVRNGADLSTFYRCSFEGYQDTLYTHSLRQFYRECDIYGTVDFIFGNAAVVFQDCNINPRQPLQGQFNSITAQGRTDPNQNTGTSIHNCSITAADDLASSNFTVETYLGRPWKNYSRTVYMQSFMGDLINPAGWHEWSGTFALSTLYYAEYDNSGPGSNTTDRVTWPGYHVINATDAANFTVSNFIAGDFWLPATGVPYVGGLL
ncbi:hypothetical protein Nepgr_013183 [Nepenthes gracilis]|uniref:Pectinesterase n=1 Tax=Nepenthes gracilis TaxID=150966 RepID=A0AAD3SIQ1_NEPGR|nr:hypothetical protein Nepgr_013183 [Nepenthes gracilis]